MKLKITTLFIGFLACLLLFFCLSISWHSDWRPNSKKTASANTLSKGLPEQYNVPITTSNSLSAKTPEANASEYSTSQTILAHEPFSTWPDAPVTQIEYFPVTTPGEFKRVAVLTPDNFKWPIRIEETFHAAPNNPQALICIHRSEMIAHQILIETTQSSQADSALVQYIGANPSLDLISLNETGLHLIRINDYQVNSVPQLLEQLPQSVNQLIYAEPDYLLKATATPNDPHYHLQWAMRNTGLGSYAYGTDIGAEKTWDVRNTAANQIIAIIDSGIRYTHEDLRDNMWVNSGEIPNDNLDNDNNGFVDDIYGYNLFGENDDPIDIDGHGTHVAGIAGARGNNGKGIAGVAWETQLMALKFLHGGNGATSDAIRAIDYARRKGATVINASWGGNDFSQGLMRAINRARADSIVFVAAAGNDSHDAGQTPSYPASYHLNNIISVASHRWDNTFSVFSDFGDVEVDVAAPGETIYSTWHSSDSAYRNNSGTSMAAPHVAGMIALLQAQHPNESMLDIIERLYASVLKSSAYTDKTVTGGRVYLENALKADGNNTYPEITFGLSNQTLTTGIPFALEVQAIGTGPFSYKWVKENQVIAQGSSPTYFIPSSSLTDSGMYSVFISNPYGTAISTAEIEVLAGVGNLGAALDAPNFSWATSGNANWSEQTDTFETGDSALVSGNIDHDGVSRLTTIVEGPGLVSFQWKISSETQKDALTFYVNNEKKLAISGENNWWRYSQRILEGVQILTWEYAKDSVNSVGEDRAYLDGFVYTPDIVNPPTIITEPVSKSISEGNDVNFIALAEGEGTLSYQWFHNGNSIHGAQTNTFTITAATTASAGDYYIIVSNEAGSTQSQTASLSIIENNDEVLTFDSYFSNYSALVDNWIEIENLGPIHVQNFPWVYHSEHGWLYADGAGGNSFTFYDTQNGWLWIDPKIYPYLWRFTPEGWFYFESINSVNWFYNLDSNQWESAISF